MMEVNTDRIELKNIYKSIDSINCERNLIVNTRKIQNFNGTILAAGEECLLLGMPYNEETVPIIESISNLNIAIEYQSVLGEKWFFDLKTKETVKR